MSTAGPQLVAAMTPFPKEFRNCKDLECWTGDTISQGAVPFLLFTYDFVVKPAMEKVVTCLVRTNLFFALKEWMGNYCGFQKINHSKKEKKMSLRSWVTEWLSWVWGKAQAGETGVFLLGCPGPWGLTWPAWDQQPHPFSPHLPLWCPCGRQIIWS